RPRGHLVLARVADGARGAGVRAVRAEQAAAQVEAQRAGAVAEDGARRAGLGAGAAALAALRRVQLGPSAEAVRQYGQLEWVAAGAVALAGALPDHAEHGVSPRGHARNKRG